MKKKPDDDSFDKAVAAFLKSLEGTREIPFQPNRTLSTRKGGYWYLRNVRERLARVSDDGEVTPF